MQSYVQLHKLYQYLKKAVNTKLSVELLRQKEKLNNALKADIENYLQEEHNNIKDKDFHSIVKNTRLWNFEIQKIINHKLEIIQLHTTRHKTSPTHSITGIAKTTISCEHAVRTLKTKNTTIIKMANENQIPFDIKQATSIVPMYDGSADDLEAFIDALTLLTELTAANQVATAVKFVKTRLTKKARLGIGNNLNTLQDIANDLKARCKSQEKPESLIAKLKQTKRKGTTVEFCEEVETLTLKLKSLYMEQQVPENVANSMATRVGLESLINGIPSNETKIILKAGSFTNIKEAILKVNENVDSNNAQVLMTNTVRQHPNHYFNNNYANRNNHTYRQQNRPTQRNNFQQVRNHNFRGNGDQRYSNNNIQRNYQNNNGTNFQRQRFNTNRQQNGFPARAANRNNDQYRRVYTGAAAQLPPAPQINSFTGTQPDYQRQNVMSQANLTYSPNASVNQLAPGSMQQMQQYPQYNFLGECPHPSQLMQ